jgi:pimeloyl-ACP methyl ester carboxylesterase
MPQIDGIALNVKVQGQGAPVLALHGWGGSIASMQMVLDRLAPHGYQVHALDFPGFGATPPPPQAWGVPEYTQLVVKYMDAAGLSRANLIGHSFGGRVSIVMGADYPDRVRRIVLANAAGVLTPPSAKSQMRQSFGRAMKGAFSLPGLSVFKPRMEAWYRERYGSEDYKTAGALRETFVKVVNLDLVPYAARIKASTLLVWGDLDDATPLWQGQHLEKTIPDAGLVVFNGTGHFAYQERIADFIRIVHTFFKGE